LKLHTHSHCVYSLTYHLVLVSKYRRKCFTDELLEYAESICKRTCEKWDIELLEFGGESDHVHLLFSAYPNLDLSKFINNLKTVSSRMIRKNFPEHLKEFYHTPVLWTRAYCLLSTGGATIEIIEKYIQNQGKK